MLCRLSLPRQISSGCLLELPVEKIKKIFGTLAVLMRQALENTYLSHYNIFVYSVF